MKIRQDDADAAFGYLSINGHALTYDRNVARSIVDTVNSSTFTDRIASRNSRELAINLTIANVQGRNASLNANFLALDPMEPSNGTTGVPPSPMPPLVTLSLNGTTPITSAPVTIRLVIANGSASVRMNNVYTELGLFNVPEVWQIQLLTSGVLPKFSIIGTFEARS